MKINQKPFQSKIDLSRMSDLVHAFPAGHLHIVDLPYRFSSWALDDPKNIGLWTNKAGDLQAWAVMQSPFWTVDIACCPNLTPLDYRQILDWVDNRAREILNRPFGRPAWFVPVFGELSKRREVLKEAGFIDQGDVGEDSWSKVFMAAPLPCMQARKPLPGGFTIHPLDGESEVDAYVTLHQTVFESKNMTFEWRRRTLQQPAYRPDLDLFIQAPDGRMAAFCIGWFDPSGPEGLPCGQIEPLGVHPDFRGLGLAQGILSETLQGFYSLGANMAYIETDNYRDAAFNLYQSAGFRVIKDVRVYRKDYSG